jgi:hypothetical protein
VQGVSISISLRLDLAGDELGIEGRHSHSSVNMGTCLVRIGLHGTAMTA